MDLIEWSRLVEVTLRRPPLICCNGKAPLHGEWTVGPWDDPEGWRVRLHHHRQNVGMLTGRGLLVVDADVYKPGGEGALDALVDATDLDRATVTALSGGGGLHLLYSYDPAVYVGSVPLEPLGFPGIEIKADGGQIIVAPSIHPDTGRPYAWEEGFGPGEVPAAPAPAKLLELLGAGTGPAGGTGGRWQPLDLDQADELDALNVEAARILVEHFGGHDPVRFRDSTVGVFRPGKVSGSASITTGFIAPGTSKVWTDGWAPFIQNRVYGIEQLRDMAGLTPQVTAPPLYVLPPGYRLWQPGDVDVPAPVLGDDAYHGPLGAFLRHVEGRVEAHPAAIGAHLLPAFATMLGRRVTYTAGADEQHTKTFWAVVGPTSSGGKGGALNASMVLIKAVKPTFLAVHSIAGIGSGETLIHEMRDVTEDKKQVEQNRIILDGELSRVLRVARREGSILADVLRSAFDSWPLRHSTKTDAETVSTGHHLSLVAGITPRELAALTEELAVLNGFANRFLYAWSRIPVLLPYGGKIDTEVVTDLAAKIDTALHDVEGDYGFDDGARELWEPFYMERREGIGDSEALRAITSRQAAHAARLSTLYAALDGAPTIGAAHLRAAIAWCDYSLGTIRRVFVGGVSGRAGVLLTAIREAGEDGLDGRDQAAVFGRNLAAGALVELRETLEAENLIFTVTVATGGRPRVLSVAITPIGGQE